MQSRYQLLGLQLLSISSVHPCSFGFKAPYLQITLRRKAADRRFWLCTFGSSIPLVSPLLRPT